MTPYKIENNTEIVRRLISIYIYIYISVSENGLSQYL